jgi:hypothetical protein
MTIAPRIIIWPRLVEQQPHVLGVDERQRHRQRRRRQQHRGEAAVRGVHRTDGES